MWIARMTTSLLISTLAMVTAGDAEAAGRGAKLGKPASATSSRKTVRNRFRYMEYTLPRSGDTMRYDVSGATGNVGYKTQGWGTGVLFAKPNRQGAVVLNDRTAAQIKRRQRGTSVVLLTPDQMSVEPAVQAAARAGGLSIGTLTVRATNVRLSGGYQDRNQLTLSFDAVLTDSSGRRVRDTFSTVLSGNLAEGPAKLTIAQIERGEVNQWGWLYPPSVANDD